MTDQKPQHATVIGAGAMGTFCAILLAKRGIRVTLWARSAERASTLRTDCENKRYLPGCAFSDLIHVTDDASAALSAPELIVSAIPCQHMRPAWEGLTSTGAIKAPIVSVAKGIEVKTLLRPTQILCDVLGDVEVAALSGPCLAPEAAAGLPTAVVIAGVDENLTAWIQESFSSSSFRVYTNADLVGTEVAGATKNIVALAAGACDGMKLGSNAKASLLTRGLVEITRLGVALGGRADTYRGLAGMGDLVVTCTSEVSRNHTAGAKLGRHMPLGEVIATSHGIIEGIESTRSIMKLAQMHRVEMPITQAVYGVLFERQSPESAIEALMARELKQE